MGFFAHGTTVSIAGEAIGGLTGISLPSESRDDVELTDHESDFDREFVPGLRNGGEVELQGNWVPADTGQAALRTNYAADAATETIIITAANAAGTTVTFTGYVKALGGDAPYDNKGAFSATIKVTGAVVVVAAPGV